MAITAKKVEENIDTLCPQVWTLSSIDSMIGRYVSVIVTALDTRFKGACPCFRLWGKVLDSNSFSCYSGVWMGTI